MIEVGYITGNGQQAVPLVVGVDTVYVHTDITAVENDGEGNAVENLFRYHEVQYTKDEYIQLMAEKLSAISEAVNE